MSGDSDRLLILGLDGATWTVLEPLRARGCLPNLDALLRRSARGTLRSIVPPVTTAAWTSLMTGCGPVRHGVFDHRYFDAEARQMKVNHAGRRRVPTIWHQLSESGRTAVSLNLPGTYPPWPVRGAIVSGMDAPHLEAALSANPEFAARLREEAPGYGLRYHWKSVPRSLEELRENADGTVEGFLGRAQGGLAADRAFPDWSVMLVQFQNLDPFQHRCWRFLDIDETGIQDEPWNAAAAGVVAGLDRALGLLLEMADRRAAAVLVASDHGFGPCRGRISVNRILLDAGIARPLGALGRIGHTAALGRDRLRRHAQRRGAPKSRGASFAASLDAQLPLDYRRTRAFAPHQDTAAMVYLNTRERDRRAPLTTPRQADEARAETIAVLAGARHPESGTTLFPRIIDVAREHDVDPTALGYPDLIAVPAEDYWVRTKLAPGQPWVEPDPNLPGTHRPEGIVAFAGPGVQPGRSLTAQLVDVAPTVLAFCGLPIPEFMEGSPLPCLASRGRLDGGGRPPAPHVWTEAPNAALAFSYSEEDQAILEKRLADLGYLE